MNPLIITATATSAGVSSRRQLSVLRARVLSNMLGDSSFFPSQDIDDFLNEAQDKISEETQCYFPIDDSITTVPGTYIYNKPADCIQIDNMTYDWTQVYKVDYSEMMKWYNNTNVPGQRTGRSSYWADAGDTTFQLYPTPSDAKQIVIHYMSYFPQLINDADISLLPRSADSAMVNYASFKLWERDGEEGKSAQYLQDYKQDLVRVKLSSLQKPIYTKTEDFLDIWTEGR